MILAGDIGGTKVNLALYEINKNKLKIIVEKQFSSKKYNDFCKIIEEFKNENNSFKIDAACFGIAGPIIEDKCIITNLPWDIEKSTLEEQLGISKIKLLNDLESTAYGMLYLDEEDFINLNPYGRNKKGNIAVIGAGTGLGEGMLYWDGSSFYPLGTEGGHTDFAPITNQQDELLLWLRKRYPGHVSYERILSGAGIYTLYEFLSETGFAKQPALMENLSLDDDKSAIVSKCALEFKDPLCMETLRLFGEIYAAEAGNLALKSMSLGGVYIGGGIAPKILPIITSEYFLSAFLAKGRFSELLRGINLKVSLNDKTALLGSAMFAFDKLIKN